MKLSEQIRTALKNHPHWSASRVAEHLGKNRNTISVIASRHKIEFMTRRELEDLIDGKTE